jgi:uncharacterized membrane protein
LYPTFEASPPGGTGLPAAVGSATGYSLNTGLPRKSVAATAQAAGCLQLEPVKRKSSDNLVILESEKDRNR